MRTGQADGIPGTEPEFGSAATTILLVALFQPTIACGCGVSVFCHRPPYVLSIRKKGKGISLMFLRQKWMNCPHLHHLLSSANVNFITTKNDGNNFNSTYSGSVVRDFSYPPFIVNTRGRH
jgi:hypothetical protein